ncbi:hypothetical protein [Dactylosporangium cerinum]
MFPDLTAPQKAAGYYLIALSMSTVLALVVPSQDGAALLGMFSPLVAVLVMLLVVTPDGRRRRPGEVSACTGWACAPGRWRSCCRPRSWRLAIWSPPRPGWRASISARCHRRTPSPAW